MPEDRAGEHAQQIENAGHDQPLGLDVPGMGAERLVAADEGVVDGPAQDRKQRDLGQRDQPANPDGGAQWTRCRDSNRRKQTEFAADIVSGVPCWHKTNRAA